MVKGLKLKVRKLYGLVSTFVEVTGEKTSRGGGLFALIKIFGIDWKTKNFGGFCIFVLSYRTKIKMQNCLSFWRRSFGSRESIQTDFLCHENDYEVIYSWKGCQIMRKKRFLQISDVVILESWKLSCFVRKTSKCYPF